MGMNLVYALIASIVVSLISLVGVVALIIKDNVLNKIIIFMVAFAAGSLIGSAFLDIIPEAAEHITNIQHLFLYVIRNQPAKGTVISGKFFYFR